MQFLLTAISGKDASISSLNKTSSWKVSHLTPKEANTFFSQYMMEYQLWGGHKLKMTADCILGIVGTSKAMGICPAGNSKNHLTNVTSLHHRGGMRPLSGGVHQQQVSYLSRAAPGRAHWGRQKKKTKNVFPVNMTRCHPNHWIKL